MINKERIQKRVKELGYTQSDYEGNHWEKKKGREDRTVSIGKERVYIDLVCHPYKEGWIFKEAKTTIGAIRIINKYD
jgi:hypothetical protein